jgi:hypothetical protein
VSAIIMVSLDFTEFLVLDAALTDYAADLRHRAEREVDGRPRQIWARLADELRDTINHVKTPNSDSPYRVELAVTGDRLHVLTTALASWARRQRTDATDAPVDDGDGADVARGLLMRITAIISEEGDGSSAGDS